jgi:hypothetical protein
MRLVLSIRSTTVLTRIFLQLHLTDGSRDIIALGIIALGNPLS